MIFLIDYENVRSGGLRGVEFLEAGDRLVLFYSDACPMVQSHLLRMMEERAGGLETVKLLRPGKNYLDMYIAVRVGEIVGQDEQARIVLVSKDHGFSAVRDYCSGYARLQHPLALSDTVEDGILRLDGASERGRMLAQRRKNVEIGSAYDAYRRRQDIHRILSEALANTVYAERLEEVCDIVERTPVGRERYLCCLRRFGREKGIELYRRMQAVV